MGCGGSKEADEPSAREFPPTNLEVDEKAVTDQSATGVKFKEVYKLGKELGSGAFSVVKEGTYKNGNQFAIKIITKSKLTKDDESALRDEIGVLKLMKHDNIIRLYDVFFESDYYYMVTEKMMGGELFDRIVQKSYYNEKEARDTCRVLFEAISYIHQRSVAHRDLKPENLLLLSDTSDSDIKIADFGFAKICDPPNSLKTQCGTPGYVAPEILEGVPYGTKADMWSLGVIAYILLGGYPPFMENDQKVLFRKIRKGTYKFHDQYWKNVSTEAKDFIKKLLIVDPAKRKSAGEIIREDPWMKEDSEKLETMDLGVNLAEFKKFNAKRKFKSAVKAVIATQKLNSLGNLKDVLD